MPGPIFGGGGISVGPGGAASYADTRLNRAAMLPCDPVATILATSGNTHYERVTSTDVADNASVIRLRSPNTYPWARTIAAASPEYGWTWANRTVLTTADENTTTSGASYGAHDTTNTDYGPTTRTAAYRYVEVTPGRALEVIGLFYSNGDSSYESTGVVVSDSATGNKTFLKMGIGNMGAGVGIHAYNGTDLPTASTTAAERNAGVWLRITYDGSTTAKAYYNKTASATPPTTWTLLNTTTLSAVLGTVRLIQVWNSTASSSGLTGGCKWWGWRYTDPINSAWGQPAATSAWLQATGRATTGDTITLAVLDFGSEVTPNITAVRARLADAINQMPGDAASWTFGLTGKATAGPTAPPTLQAAGSLVLKESGSDTAAAAAYRYWSLFASAASSGGTQAGSIDLGLVSVGP